VFSIIHRLIKAKKGIKKRPAYDPPLLCSRYTLATEPEGKRMAAY